MLGGQEGVNEIAETLTSESTKQLKSGNPVMMADNTKKETKLANIEVDGEQPADNRSGGMIVIKDDMQKKTFSDFVKDVHEGGDNKQDKVEVDPAAINPDNNDDND